MSNGTIVVYLINQTTKKASKADGFLNKTPMVGEDGKLTISATFPIDAKEKNHVFEIFFNKQEWLEEVAKL